MDKKKAKDATPENIRRIIDIVAAIIGRISHKSLENNAMPCLCIGKQKGYLND